MADGRSGVVTYYSKEAIEAIKGAHPQYFDRNAYEEQIRQSENQARIKRDMIRQEQELRTQKAQDEMVRKAYKGSSGLSSNVGQYNDFLRYGLPGMFTAVMREAPSTATAACIQDSAYVASRNGRIIEYREKLEPRQPLHKRFMKALNKILNKNKVKPATTVHKVDEGTQECIKPVDAVARPESQLISRTTADAISSQKS